MEVPESTVAWLLEPDDPAVRYRTQTELLRLDPTAPAVRESWARRMDDPVTRAILAQGEAFWNEPAKAYAKYTGLYWQTIFLGHFLADGSAPGLREGLEALLADHGWVNRHGGQCLTANLLTALRRMGYGAHPRVLAETEALAERTLRDGGVACEAMGYSLLEHCHMSVPKLLACFALVPAHERSEAVQDAIGLLARHLLDLEVYVYVPGHRHAWREVLASAPKRAELPTGTTVKAWIADARRRFLAAEGLGPLEEKPGWRRFGFPRSYASDVLEATWTLARAGVPMSDALERPLTLIESKADDAARWTMEDSLNGKMRVDVERVGEASKWLTLFALTTLAHFRGLEVPGAPASRAAPAA
jgi:hypothetical protein